MFSGPWTGFRDCFYPILVIKKCRARLLRVAPVSARILGRVMSTTEAGRESIMIIGKESFGSTRAEEHPGRCNVPFAVLSLLVMLLIIYGNSFFGEWHFDDYHNIVDNRNVHLQGLSWQEIRKTFFGIADGSEGGHSTRPHCLPQLRAELFLRGNGRLRLPRGELRHPLRRSRLFVSLYLQNPSAAPPPGPLRGEGIRHRPAGDVLLGDEPPTGPRRDDHRPADGKPCRARHDHGPVLLRPGENGRGRERPLGICASLRCRVASGLRIEGKCGHAADLDPPVRRPAGPGSIAGKPFHDC